jgi:hypothetical protein
MFPKSVSQFSRCHMRQTDRQAWRSQCNTHFCNFATNDPKILYYVIAIYCKHNIVTAYLRQFFFASQLMLRTIMFQNIIKEGCNYRRKTSRVSSQISVGTGNKKHESTSRRAVV